MVSKMHAETNEVDKAQALGCKVKYKLLHPDHIVSMDEAGYKGDLLQG